MIELSNDPDENVQIIGAAKRYNEWYDIECALDSLVGICKEYPIKNKEELDKLDNIIRRLTELRNY